MFGYYQNLIRRWVNSSPFFIQPGNGENFEGPAKVEHFDLRER
jgi:hypothetical protein